MEKFTVTLNHHAHYGYVEYDPETKTAKNMTRKPKPLMLCWMFRKLKQG